MGVINIRFLKKGSKTINLPLKKASWYKVLSAASKDLVSEIAVQLNIQFLRSNLFFRVMLQLTFLGSLC
jgi:hypothetical protein